MMSRVYGICAHLQTLDDGERCSKPACRAIIVDHTQPKGCDRQETFLVTASLHYRQCICLLVCFLVTIHCI